MKSPIFYLLQTIVKQLGKFPCRRQLDKIQWNQWDYSKEFKTQNEVVYCWTIQILNFFYYVISFILEYKKYDQSKHFNLYANILKEF